MTRKKRLPWWAWTLIGVGSVSVLLFGALVVSAAVVAVTNSALLPAPPMTSTTHKPTALSKSDGAVPTLSSPTPTPSPTAPSAAPAIMTGSDGTCPTTEASWSTFGDSTVEIVTFVSGPVTAQVNIPGKPSQNRYITVPADALPYTINVTGVDLPNVGSVYLYSRADGDRSSCAVTKQQ